MKYDKIWQYDQNTSNRAYPDIFWDIQNSRNVTIQYSENVASEAHKSFKNEKNKILSQFSQTESVLGKFIGQ